MTEDQQFRKFYEPLHVPAAFEEAVSDEDKIIFALADIGEGNADDKLLIAAAHKVLTELYQHGRIAGHEKEGNLVYNLKKYYIRERWQCRS